MEQPPPAPTPEDEERAFRAIIAVVERLDELPLSDETGRALVEPASTFSWT
jgi:hypothetical protein